MAPTTRRGPNTPVNNTNPNNMTPESIQAMIDQALLQNSTNGDGSHSSYKDNRRNGTEGVVGLTRWIEKMESVFNISGCAIENQVKFATCTLLGAALTWWNGQIRTLGPEAYAMSWEVKGNDVPAYTERFQELTLICTKFVANETEKVDKNSTPTQKGSLTTKGRLMIYPETTMVTSNNPSRGKMSPRSTIWGQAKRSRMGDLCLSALSATFTTMVRAPRGATSATGNAKKRGNAPGNVVTGTFLLNNHNASILFDTGADRSFISTAFSSLINIAPTLLENCYDVELADEKLVGIDTIIRGYTLNFLNHPFNIDLMPVALGSFDVIIGMDWLRKCHVMIVCDEKLVQVPYGYETLTFCGNESSNGRESRLTVISCSKVQEYMTKGCQVFLAQISAKKEEDKSEGKRIKDVPIVQDFPEVFLEDFPGLPLARPVKFQIDLIPGAAPVARALYRLAPSEIKELSEQLHELI
ncbi:putative reverse transcriptase domain-containing protein [Tanacetum coccineum]